MILLEPLPAGRIGWALAAGVCPAMVDMMSATDRFADVTDGQSGYLTSGAEGSARILWAETGTGQRRAMILLGGAGGGKACFWGTLDAELEHGDTEGVSVTLDAGGTQADVLPPKGMTLGKLAKDTPVLIEQVDGEWYVVWAVQTLAVITALRRDSGKLQYKTTDALVFVAGDPAATWTDVAGQTAIASQTVVTEIEMDGLGPREDDAIHLRRSGRGRIRTGNRA